MSEELTGNSLQCDVCLVKLRNAAAAQLHAEKTDHQAFSESTEEIKPLTEEEKKAKLQELREKLALKRKLEAEKEAENLKKNASIERKKTQESAEMIDSLQRKEELKAIAARKKEKEDDLKAKQRVRAQLEEDKKMRAEKAAAAKALRTGQVPPQAVRSDPTPARPVADHSNARLQIRHSGNNKPIVKQWDKRASMMQVATEIEAQTGVNPESAVFKMFGQVIRGQSLSKTLEELGLVPSASLTLSTG